LLPLPRVLFCAFDGGLEAGGNALRRHIRRHVTPQLGGKEILPPTSFNHWFAFRNDFSAESLRPAVEASAAAGLEYFCVDGGWYRGGFGRGVGNWEEGDPAKFPDGIKPFSDYVREQGLKYGTWFEPEWAIFDSEIYLAHPDWFWPSSPQNESHMMNFGLPAVREWWLQRFIRAYQEWGMRWVRWDCNTPPDSYWTFGLKPGEIGWRQIEHVTGLYQVLDDIMAACPELLIEQCASGGHRIELGTVRRGHTFWMNDHTTNTEVVRFMQHGLNTILPGNYPNTNLCQARFDFTDYDFLSHGAGGFGYSGWLWEMPPADFERFKAAIKRFKEYRHLLLGDYERSTGQAQRYNEYSKVVFREGNDSLTLEFNLAQAVRSAALHYG
jgi:alpha-galactosidase